MVLMTMIARLADALPLAASMQEDEQAGKGISEYQAQAKQLFRKLNNMSPAKSSIETGPYIYHYLIENEVCYLVLCDKAFSKRLAFSYLEDLQNEFHSQYSKKIPTVSRPYCLIEFDTYMQKAKKRVMDSRSRGHLSAINSELQDVQRIMVQNIDDVLQRGAALSTLDNKASNLSMLSQKYKKDARYLNLKSTYAKVAAGCIDYRVAQDSQRYRRTPSPPALGYTKTAAYDWSLFVSPPSWASAKTVTSWEEEMSSASGGVTMKILDLPKWSQVGKLLISAGDTPFERNELTTLVNTILASEQELKFCSEEDASFLTIIGVLSAHHITNGLENVSKVQLQNVTRACRILIEFLVSRLRHYDPSMGCSQKHLLMVLLGLCKGTGYLHSTDRKSLVNSNEFLQQFLQKISSDDAESKQSRWRLTQDPGALIVEQLMHPVYDATEETLGWNLPDRELDPQLGSSAANELVAVFASKNAQFLMSLDCGTDVIDMCLKLPQVETYLTVYLDAVVTGTLTLPPSTARLSLQGLLNDVSIIHWALSLPILEPLDVERFRNLFTLSAACLVMSVVVATASGSQAAGGTSKTLPGKDDDSDLQAVEIMRKCLEIFHLTCKATRDSTRASGHNLQNCEMIGAWILLTGLQAILGKPPRTTSVAQPQSPKDPQKPMASSTPTSTKSVTSTASRQNLLRVQQSFSVLAVGLANQAVTLLASLFRNTRPEPAATAPSIAANLDVLATFHAQQRIQLIFNSFNLNNLVFNLAAISYRKACSLRHCQEKPVSGDAASSSDSSYYDDDFSCSGDSSPEVDDDDDSEPILGHWFEETITPVDSGRSEPPPTSSGNISAAFDASHDSQPSHIRPELQFVPEKGSPHGFIRLATSVLSFANRYLLCTDDSAVREYTSSRLCEQHVIILAGLLRDVDKEIARSECEPGNTVGPLYAAFSTCLSKLMHNLITLELLSTDLQNLLLTQLGVNPWSGEDWPLQVNSRTLAVVAKVLLLLAQRDRSRFVDESDAACCTIWKRLLHTLQVAILGPESGVSTASADGTDDLNVEHAQLLLFLLQSVPLTCKRMVLLDCANAIMAVVEVVDTVMKESQILHLTRLLLVFEYFLKHMYMAPTELIEQVRWNVFGELCAPETEDSNRKHDCKMFFPFKKSSDDPPDPRFYVLCPPYVIDNVIQKPDQLAVNTLLNCAQMEFAEFQRNLMRFLKIGRQWDMPQRQPGKQLSPLAAQLTQCAMEATWRILLTMPPAVGFLEDLHGLFVPEHTCNEAFLVPLASMWATRVANKRVSTWLKESLGHQGCDADKCDKLLSRVVEKCAKIEHDVRVAKALFTNLLTRYENITAGALMARQEILQIADVCVLDTVVAKLQVALGEHIKKPSPELEQQMKEIAEDFIPSLLKVINIIRKVIRASLLYQAADKCEADCHLGASSLHALSLVLGLTSSRCVHTTSLASSLTELLPPSLRSVIKMWNSLSLDDFPIAGDWRDDGSEDLILSERFVISVHHGHWQALANNPQHAAHISLKHLLQSLSRFPADMLVWLSEHKLAAGVVDSLFPLTIDGTTENIAQVVTLSVEQLVGTAESEEYLVQVYFHVISIGYDLLVNCTSNCADMDERIFHEIAKFFEIIVEKSAGRKAMEKYFIDGKGELGKLLLSISNGEMSPNYASKVLKFFNKLYQLAEKSPSDRSLEALCASLSSLSTAAPQVLQLWLEKITCTSTDAANNLSAEDSSLNTVQENRQQLQVLTSYFIKNNSIGEDLALTLLDDLIPMATHVLANSVTNSSSGFAELLTVMATLAGVGSSGRGHVKLFKDATMWLATCKAYLIKNDALQELDDHLLLGSFHGMTEIACRILTYVAEVLGAIKVLSDRWDARNGVTSPPHDTEFFPQDVDSDWAEEMGQDDDSAAEDSDEDSLSNKLCTFTLTQKDFMNQHWYHCHTCKMVDGVGVCTICAKVCHRDHDVTYAKYGSFFCDCGAKEDGSCQALVKRAALVNEPSTGPSIGSGATQFQSDLALPSSLRRKLSATNSAQMERGSDPRGTRNAGDMANCRKKALLTSQLEAHSDTIISHLMNEDVASCVLDLLEKLKGSVEHHCMHNSPMGSVMHMRDSLRDLHSKPVNFVQTDQLMVPTLGSQEGAFENVRLTLSGEQGQTIRQLLSAHVIHRVAMCLLAAPSGRRQHLAVSHEKGKITVLQLSTLLRQADSGKRKLTLTKLASAPVPFTVLSMAGNPCNDEVLALCGLKECHVMTFNTSGTVADHLVLHTQGAFGNFLIKAVWLPGSQTELALIMPDIVKIFDLSVDVVNPQYYFLLPESKIRDCCFVMTEDGGRYALLMCASGHIYMQQLCEESLAQHGPFYVTNVLEVEHPDLQDSNGQLCGGGVSVYYSHTLQLLFFSYSRGKTFVASLQKMKNELTDVHLIALKNNGSGKGNGQPLWQWTEVVGHPGLVCCLTQSSNNPVVLMVRPENIFVQEIKVQPAKAKITDMVALRHPACGTEHRTTLILLCEDGSLKIYTASSDQTGFWLNPSQTVFSSCGSSSSRQPKKKKVAKASRPSGAVTFPVDFFEHCQSMNDVEFGGNDLLQIYNVQQLKHRLNSAGMYVVSSKAVGFNIEVTNPDSGTVITGVRVLLGGQDVQKVPSYIEIFNRSVQVTLTRSRWYDFPLTREESLQAAKKLTIFFGTSAFSAGVTMVDSIKIYGKSKEVFGWPDDNEEFAAVSPTSGPTPSIQNHETEGHQPTAVQPLSLFDRFLSSVLQTLDGCFSVLGQRSSATISRNTALDLFTGLLILPMPPTVQQQVKILLATMHPSRLAYHNHKDQALLGHVVSSLRATRASNLKDVPLDPDAFYSLVAMARAVAVAHPWNLVRFADCHDTDGQQDDHDHLAVQLVNAFWKLHSQQPANVYLAPVSKPALVNVDLVVQALVEVVHTFSSVDLDDVPLAAKLYTSLLFAEDVTVSFACKQVLIRLLRPRLRRRRVCIPSPPRCSTPGGSAVTKRAVREAAEMLMSLEDAMLVEGGAVGVAGFPAELDVIPPDADDDEMVELAIALSLQEQVSSGGVAGGSMGVSGNNVHYSDAAAMAGVSDDDEGSTAATDGSTLRTPPAEAAGSPSASGSRSGSESADSMTGGDVLAGTGSGSGRSSANGDHRPESTTTGARSETSSVGAPSTSMPQELEGDGEAEAEAEAECEGMEAGTDLHALRLLLLDHLVQEMERLREFSGVRAIPYLQVILMLTSDLDGDESKDRAALDRILAATLAELGPRTTLVASETITRTSHHEVQLVLMRLLSVMMSRPKSSSGSAKCESQESFLSCTTANTLLAHGVIDFCLRILRSLLAYWKHQQAQETAHTANGSGAPSSPSVSAPGTVPSPGSSSATGSGTLKKHVAYPPPNMSPFFLRQYVKGHADDVFKAFPHLLTEMALRLPYQMKKITDAAAPAFDHAWYYLLCEYMAIPQAPFVRKQVRKLLLFLCGSKERYRQLRDTCSLESGLREVRILCTPVLSQPGTQLPYEALLSLVEHLRACAEVATGRTANWQQFCERDDAVLPFLIRISPLLDDGVAAVVLQLLQAAICPKTKDTAGETLPARLVHRLVDPALLLDFARAFLLESATSAVRWQAHALIAGMFEHSNDDQRAKLLEMLWQLWPSVPSFVGKAAQFVDLLGHFAIHVPLDAAASREHAERAIGLLRSQNKLLSLHPNSGLYAALQVLVELDGYYLEAEPCLVCTDLEVPFANVKVSALKVDSCFTTTTQIVKLIGGHLISRITLRVGDLKRAKMVRTINIYYSQRSAPAIVELKNRPALWQKARRCSLVAGQTELKVDFPLPITACNLIIEYADFYENAQASSESLQCPRCSTSVPANPGVCANCGENVFQCHKCRTINYDEKDPFLCNFCGFCKYAKFDFTLTARPCCAVDPIENEDDRKKAVLTINTLLEKADRVYRQLSAHKPALEALFRRVIDHSAEVSNADLGAPASAQGTTVAPAAITSPSVNRTVLHLAQRYCGDCKNAYEELTKMIQKVLACRRQLVEYDRRHGCRLGQMVPRQTLSAASRDSKTSCYGCAIAAIEHCVTLLRALAIDPKTRAILCSLGLVRELAENNLRRGSLQVCTDVRMLLCLLIQDNPNATDELNALIMDKVRTAVRGRLPGPDLASAVHQEMTLLATSAKKHDSCWERRIRCVVQLFVLGVNSRDPVVMEAIMLPCLRILQSQVQPPVPLSKKNKDRAVESAANLPLAGTDIRLDFRKWLAGDPAHSYDRWKQLAPKKMPEPDTESVKKEKVKTARTDFLRDKYGRRWLRKVNRTEAQPAKLTDCEWLRHLIFNPVSRVARQETCNMLEALCHTPARKAEVVNLLTSFLSDLSVVGENSTEFITLYQNLIKSEQWKAFVAARGLLPTLGQLVTAEIERLGELEETTLTSNLGEGYALKLLTELLANFMEQESVRRIFKSRLVGTVLNGYLALCKLVIQRTKLVDDAQDKLLELLEEMTAGTEEEKETFMSVCVQTLTKCPIKDFRTPVFVFERLCSVIHPEDNDVGEFFVSLEKDPQQEDFLQGRMLSNPYSSADPGLGPLMRDIKNKICQDCELVALLEDDNGMELLVANKIISLDLPVKEVFKKVWLVENGDGEAMRIVYRMRGLLGDATEEFIESLAPAGGEVVDNEEVYKLANCMATCGGLDIMLERLDAIDDLARGQTLVVVLLKLFGYCIKVKSNRRELMKSELRAVGIMLTKVKQMLSCDSDTLPAAQGGLSITEQLLMLMETILIEASEDPTEMHACGSVEDIRFLLERVMTSQSQRALSASVLQRLLRVMSFLALGSSDKMDEVVVHFKSLTNLSQFDFDHGTKVDHKMECLCVLANGIEPNAYGGKLKSKMIDAGIVQDLLNYIFAHAPSTSSALLGDSDEFKEFICKPALKYVLRLLTGLSRGHPPTQQLVIADCIPVIHRLEQVSSDEHVGSLAENLMEVLRENPEVAQKIEDVRKQTRAEKKRMAMAMREKHLAGLGMRTNEKGQVTAKASILKQVEELADESGLVCVICREGYKFQPAKVLCVYTYTKRANADDAENKARKTPAYVTVSHFNVVHVDCHVSAVRLARSRDEWESAALQNGNTRCNGLLPLWGPDVPEPAFANCLARHNTYLQDCTGHRDIGFTSTMHDMKLLLMKFACEKSFSEESGGGGPQSNMHLLPYLLHTALYVLNTTRLSAREEANLAAYLDMNKEKWVENCFQVEGPLYWVTVALTVHSPTVWAEKRVTHLRRLLVLAHARHVAPGGTTKISDKVAKEYAVYKPVLVLFALINNLYSTVFKKVTATDGVEWSVALADYIRHNDQALLEAVDKLLTQYQDELLPCASLEEFLDVVGLLEDIHDPESFLSTTLISLPN